MLPREVVKDGGENDVRNNDQKRRLDHSASGGPTDSVGPAVDSKPLEATHVDDNGRERQALDQAANHIAQLDRSQHVVKVEAQAKVGSKKHEDYARQHDANDGLDGETGYHDQRSYILWR